MAGSSQTSKLSDHWRLWNSFVFRGAGFPVNLVEILATPNLAAAVDELADIEERLEKAFRSTRTLVFDTIPKDDSGRDKALKKLAKGKIPTNLPPDGPAGEAIEALRTLESERTALQARLESLYRDDDDEVVRALAKVACDPQFVEALGWQNPSAASKALSKVQEPHFQANSQLRQSQRFVAKYLQRYCLKNDTIGFFGPVAWGRIDLNQATSTSEPGPELIKRTRVFFEDWAVDRLAQTFSRDIELLRHVAPRLHPWIRVEGDTLESGPTETMDVPEEVAALLEACDGKTAQEIADSLGEELELEDEEIFELLEQLVEQDVLIWSIEVPELSGRALADLRERLSTLGPAAASYIEEIDRLDDLRNALEASSGDPDKVQAAHSRLEDAFAEITGSAVRRHSGEMYAGRTIVYSDCYRDHEVILGQDFIDRLAPSLRCILQSARWFTNEGAKRYQTVIEGFYEQLRQEDGQQSQSLLRVLNGILEKLDLGDNDLERELVRDLQQKWSELIGDLGNGPVELSSSELASEIDRVFASSPPCSPSGRYQAPDLMLSATSLEDAFAGKGLGVLGETHVGMNTVVPPMFIRWHPDPEALTRQYADEVGPNFIEPVPRKLDAGRAHPLGPSDTHYQIVSGRALPQRPLERQLRIADLAVVPENDSIVVKHRDTGATFPLLAVFEAFTAWLRHSFSIVGDAPHTPRVTIDRLVISRERWTIRSEEFPKFPESRGLAQFLAIRRWAHTLGLPRFVFYKSPEEVKPIYLDLNSPISTEIFASIMRKASKLSLSEMLPTPEDAWLTDAKGNRYTSELRLIAVDTSDLA